MARFWSKPVAALVVLVLGIGTASAQSDQRAALVIGNSTYSNIGPLKNPENDARAMAAMLRRAGFDVVELENAKRRAMIEAARTFAERLSPGGVGLFYYAGHGVQVRGGNYLLPTDATMTVEDDVRYEAFDVQDVLNKLDDARVRLSLVILDACRDNPFARTFRSTTRGLARIDAPRGTLIAYATAPGKLAADGEGDNGVYTTELLKAMAEPGRKIQEVFEVVTGAVERRTRNEQTPWISSSIRGDFYFFPPDKTPGGGGGGSSNADMEQAAWLAAASSSTAGPYEAFLQRFPNSVFADIARAKIKELRGREEALLTPRPVAASIGGAWNIKWSNNSTNRVELRQNTSGGVVGEYVDDNGRNCGLSGTFLSTSRKVNVTIRCQAFEARLDGTISPDGNYAQGDYSLTQGKPGTFSMSR